MTRNPIARLGRMGVIALACAVVLSLALPLAAHAVPDTRAFYGTVTDSATGDPIEQAEVSLWDEDDVQWGSAYTNAAGLYELDSDGSSVPAGPYVLYVNTLYLGTETHRAEVEWVTYDGVTAQKMDFELDPIVLAFRGTVTDSKGDPIEDSWVELYDDSTGYVDWVYADENGAYELYAPVGTYEVWGSAWKYNDSDSVIRAFNGSTPQAVNFVLSPWARAFYGKVTDSKTGLPIKGAAVYHSDYMSWDDTVFTDANGAYEIYAPKDDYYFYVSANGYFEQSAWVSFDGTTAVKRDFALLGGALSGANRFDTAVLVSKAAYPDGLDPEGDRTVVIATGMNWPDALGAAALAGALDGPILLTQQNAIPAEIMAEITRLGAKKAIIVGGETAVSGAVKAALEKQLGGSANVTRIAGTNRYETADKVAAKVIELAGEYFSGDAFIATGANFADALAASPIAAYALRPIYLVPATAAGAPALPTTVERVVILGGEGAVNAKVEADLKAKLGKEDVVRLGGAGRYETAINIATYGVDDIGLWWDGVAVTTGTNFPDALAGGVLQGKMWSVIVLTDPAKLSAAPQKAFMDHKDEITEVRYLGGLSAISQGVRSSIAGILK